MIVFFNCWYNYFPLTCETLVWIVLYKPFRSKKHQSLKKICIWGICTGKYQIAPKSNINKATDVMDEAPGAADLQMMAQNI